MPLWRCPHCATPQPEASRCWLCGRSTTTCAACRHYRRSVAGGIGLCGRSPRRLALRGTEVLPCWEALPSASDPASAAGDGKAVGDAAGDPVRAPRTFVPVDELRAGRADACLPTGPAPAAGGAIPARWSLWGEIEG